MEHTHLHTQQKPSQSSTPLNRQLTDIPPHMLGHGGRYRVLSTQRLLRVEGIHSNGVSGRATAIDSNKYQWMAGSELRCTRRISYHTKICIERNCKHHFLSERDVA
jgi:hypothetical protein